MRIPPVVLADAHLDFKTSLRQWSQYLLPSLCLVAVALLWVHKLFWGFWVDEAGTFWMANEGVIGALRKCSQWPGQSILFGAIESFFVSQGPHREFIMRIPSIFGIAVTAVFLYRLTNRLVGEGAGYLAVLPFLCAPPTVFAATNARPYALAAACAVGATWALWEWIETSSRAYLAIYFVSSLAVIYLHYFFTAIFVVHLLYVVLYGRRPLLADWRRFVLGFAATALCILPLRTHIALLARESGRLSAQHHLNTASELLSFWFPTTTLYGVCVGFCAVLVLFGAGALRGAGYLNLRRRDILLLFLWLFLLPACFWLLARLTHHNLFVARYLFFAVPAFYVLLSIPLSTLRQNSARLVMLVSIVGVAGIMGGLRTDFARGPNELRAPLNQIVRAAGSDRVPVFISSGLHESTSMNWRSGLAADSYLFAPLAVYRIPNPILPLPYQMTVYAEQYVDGIIRNSTMSCPRFLLLVVGDIGVAGRMIERFKEAGYSPKELTVNQLPVFVFDRK